MQPPRAPQPATPYLHLLLSAASRGLLHGDSQGDHLAYLRLQAKGLLERGVQPLGAWALGQTLDAMSLYGLSLIHI